MHLPKNLKKQLIYIFRALLDGFVLGSAIALVYAAKTGSVISVIQSAAEINLPLLLISTGVIGLLFFILFFVKGRVYRWITPLCVTVFSASVSLSIRYGSAYFQLAMCGIVIGLLLTAKEKLPCLPAKLLKGKNLYMIVTVLAAFMTAQAAFTSIARHLCYGSSTFDLGIFAQMYGYMAHDLTQNTTLERGALLSHFAVHFSPIYYLLLPLYMLFPSVELLLTAQAAVCFSGVIPLLLLCKRWRYSESVTLAVSLIFLVYPAFCGGLFYDFHENAFLVPLLLWALYFLEGNNSLGIAVSALLILCVKEDAGIYVVFMALYALFGKNVRRYNAVLLLIMGIGGFIGAASLLEAVGEGVKVSRYNIFLTNGQDSLTDVVINVFKNPFFFFTKLLSGEKLLFLLQMLVPLMLLPLRTRKLSDWMLLAPLVIVHLASDYAYQADIHYQYVFGTGVLLVFLCAKNIRYCKEKTKTAAAAILAGAIILTGSMSGKYRYIETLWENHDEITLTDQTLAMIPDDAVVFSSTYFTPHLARCRELYMYPAIYEKNNGIEPDYVVLDSRSGLLAEYGELYTLWLSKGYEVVGFEGYATVLKKGE
ncbi:MAG: DUF2079 domain-containing protein [Oscillospiraceae bacterium]|nr:DUF2079 domain-containing protein [Oscillospiraceae bacterium]